MEHDARDRVHHRRERRDRNDISRGFNRALLGVALDLLQSICRRRRPDVAQFLEDSERVVFEEDRELGIPIPRADNRILVDAECLTGERRNERARLLQLHITLA